MGKRSNKKNFKKVPYTEVFSTTPSVPDRENRSKHNQGLKRSNEGETYNQGTTVAQSTTTGVASSCEINEKNDNISSWNDSGIGNVNESYGITQSAVIANINTKVAYGAMHVCSSYNITEDTPTVLTEKMTKLDVGHTKDQRGFGLNADAAEFIPTPNQKFTTGNASVSCTTTSNSSTSFSEWSSEPSTSLKPSMSNSPGHLSHQTSTFSNSNRHRNRNHTPNIYKPIGINTAGNFERQSRLQQKEITEESYTPPRHELYQKRERTVQGGTSQTYRNTNYIDAKDYEKAQINDATRGISKDNSEIIWISDSDSESEDSSSDCNNEKLSHRSKSREKNKTERKHKHRSKSRDKKEKSNEDNYSGNRDRKHERKTHRSRSREEKYKHRSKSRDKKGKSHAEDNSDSGDKKHRTKTHRSHSREEKHKHRSKSRDKKGKSNAENNSDSGDKKHWTKTHRSHSREEKHKHRSKSRDKKGKSNAEDNSDSGDRKHTTKTHRSKSPDEIEKRHKHKSRSPNAEEKSDAEDNFSGGGGRKRGTKSRAKQDLSHNTFEPERKVDDYGKSRQRNVPSRSNNFNENESFQNREYRRRDIRHDPSFAGRSEKNWGMDLSSGSTKTKEVTARNATSREQMWQNSNRAKSYDTDRSDHRNDKNDNFSQDSPPWQQAKGGRNRGSQHKRKPQTNRSDMYSQDNSRRQQSNVDVSAPNLDYNDEVEGADRKTEKNSPQPYEKSWTNSHGLPVDSASYQNRTQKSRRGMYNSNDHNRQKKTFDRQAEMDKSGYNNTKNQIQLPPSEENDLKSESSRQHSQNLPFAWKPEYYNPENHNQLSADTSQENWDDELEPNCVSQPNRTVPSARDEVNMKPENEKRSEGIAVPQRNFDRQFFNRDESTHLDSSPAGNWRNKDARQSWGSSSTDKKDKVEPPQRKSLGQERQTKKLRDPGMERRTDMNWRDNSQTDDPEYKAFLEIERCDEEIKYVKVEEKSGDLFEMPKEYSLAHCVAEDLSMGSGIAVQFKRDFKRLGELYDQRQKQGGLAILEPKQDDSERYIYYLVTKRESSGKPTYFTFWSSVKKMRDHIRDNGVKKLAIPRIGCGLDRLEWSRVKHMVEFLFRDVDVEIVVCNFQQDGDTPTKEQRGIYCRVVRETYHITQIESYSIIIYFSTEDGFISDEMLELQKKCNFISKFDQTRKALGEVVRFDDWKNNYILYGCIVRKTRNQPFHFTSFVKCLAQINKQNKTDCMNYVGIPAVRDGIDPLLNFKIVNTAKTYLRNVQIYQCFGKEGDEKSPKDTENEHSVISLDTFFENEGGEINSKDTENGDSIVPLNDTKDQWW